MTAQNPWSWHAELADSLEVESDSNASVELKPAGKHSFEHVSGSPGWIPEHPRSALRVPFEGWSDGTAGTLSAWVSPLEEVGPWVIVDSDIEGENGLPVLPVFSDTYPRRNESESVLALTVYPGSRVGLQARGIGRGSGYLPEYIDSSRPLVTGGREQSELTQATLYQPSFPMQPGKWYHVGIGWDVDQNRLEMYANGECINIGEDRAFNVPDQAIYIGNPFMAVANVRGSDRLLDAEEVTESFEVDRTTHDRALDPASRSATHGVTYDPISVDRESYTLQTELALTDQSEVDQFVQHGPDDTILRECRATPEGLLFETPDTWKHQACTTLWAPGNYEGDVLVECDFKLERPEGLALLIFNASTFDRADVIDHRNYDETGHMRTLLSDMRAYWWEFHRKTPPTRKRDDTHILLKAPHGNPPLDDNIGDLPDVGTWHTLTVSKEGDRIRGAIDDTVLVDADESDFPGNGPSLNTGRVGIRHMQKTRIRYRDLRVRTRSPSYRSE